MRNSPSRVQIALVYYLLIGLWPLLAEPVAAQPALLPPSASEVAAPEQKSSATVEALEKRVEELEAAKAKEAGKSPGVAGWNNGFFLRSEDRKYEIRFTGQIQGDYRNFLDSQDTTDIDTFLVRRARFGIEATVWEFFDFRLLPDFGQSTPRLQDAFMNVHYWDAFQVQVGKFRQPVSYELLIQDRFVPTMERSIIDQLVPGRDVGVMIHGQKLLDDHLDYAVSVFNGENNGNMDTNGRPDVGGRIAVRPFASSEPGAPLRTLQIGISGTTGIENEPMAPSILQTPATVPFFQFNAGVRADGLRTRWTPEISWFWGSFGSAAQYFRMDQEIEPAPTPGFVPRPVRVSFEGFYVLATYLVTGEERTTYSQPVDPLRPFQPCHPLSYPGAWELVARLSRLNVGDEVFAPGAARLANPALWSAGATELTLGFNWYLNKWARVQFNWEHAWFDAPVQLGIGPGGRLNHQDTLLTRLQVIF